jgi:hypothetical protein
MGKESYRSEQIRLAHCFSVLAALPKIVIPKNGQASDCDITKSTRSEGATEEIGSEHPLGDKDLEVVAV